MFNIIKSAIIAGGYKLAEINHKINKLWISGDITELEADELRELASRGVNPDAERPEVLAMLRALSDRIDALEAKLAEKDGGTVEPEAPAEYEAWAPWDGISDKYQPGSIVSHGGKLWQSEYAGQNVWEPGTTGTAALWVEYTA